MDRHFSSRVQVSGPVHGNFAFYCPKLPVLGALQNAEQLPQNSLVQSLRNALISAVNEIKSLNEENKALKEQVGLLKAGSQVEVSQLQEELKEKEELLRRITKKRRARTKAHIDCLGLLAKKDTELKSSEEHWTKKCDGLRENLQQEMAHREESWRRKVQEVEHERNLLCEEWQRKEEEWRKRESQSHEQINDLTTKNKLLLEQCPSYSSFKALKEQVGLLKDGNQVEVSQLQEELKEKEELLKRITKKRRARTKAHIDCLGLLAKKDTKLKCSKEHWTKKCDGLEESLQQEMAHSELTTKNKLLLELVTNAKVQLENKIKKEHEVKEMKEEEEEISREGEKVKDQGNKKMENTECDKVGDEPEMSDGTLKNEKKERKTKKKRGKKKVNRG